jgi:hypothetical protein
MANRALREQVVKEGRALIEEIYSWDIIGAKLVESYAGLSGAGDRKVQRL